MAPHQFKLFDEERVCVPIMKALCHEAVDTAVREALEEASIDAWMTVAQMKKSVLEKMETAFENPAIREMYQRIQKNMEKIRQLLATPKKMKKPVLSELTFSEEVLAEVARMIEYEGERIQIALLCAMVETRKPMTAEMLSQRTGYTTTSLATPIHNISEHLLRKKWFITGRSTSGWSVFARESVGAD